MRQCAVLTQQTRGIPANNDRKVGRGTHHELVPHFKDLFEVGRHGLSLVSEPAVRANADAVLARHRQNRRSIVLQDRLRNQAKHEVDERLVWEIGMIREELDNNYDVSTVLS